MELTGERTLALSRERVWEALNDPDILKRCLPGCELFERESDERYKVGMTAAVGPIKARFNGSLTLSDIEPPRAYALAFEGSGGAAGFGKGNARVSLTEESGGVTRLSYAVNAQVGGRLAQVGARLVDGVARKMSDQFFTRFARAVVPEGTCLEEGAHAALAVPSPQPPEAAPAARSAVPATLTESERGKSLTTTLTVLGAAISTVAAAVAVLAAAIALQAAH